MNAIELLINYQTSTVGMDESFHPTSSWACDYLPMLGLKINHVRGRGPFTTSWLLLWWMSSVSDSCEVKWSFVYLQTQRPSLLCMPMQRFGWCHFVCISMVNAWVLMIFLVYFWRRCNFSFYQETWIGSMAGNGGFWHCFSRWFSRTLTATQKCDSRRCPLPVLFRLPEMCDVLISSHRRPRVPYIVRPETAPYAPCHRKSLQIQHFRVKCTFWTARRTLVR